MLGTKACLKLWWIAAVMTADASVISSSHGRMPMGLSSVITDLEAEGCSEVATAAVVTSPSVTSGELSLLLQTMFGELEAEQDDDETPITALGKKVHDDFGLALGQPPRNAVVSTVMACQGTVLYVVSSEDLHRGEGLMENLAPAMEQLLLQQQQENADGDTTGRKRNCLIVVPTAGAPLELAKMEVEKAASVALATGIVQPERTKSRAAVLSDVFAEVYYVPPAQVQALLSQKGGACAPADAALAISSVVGAMGRAEMPAPKRMSPTDLAAARKLGPISKAALEDAISTVRDVVTSSSSGDDKLVSEFGSLVSATANRALAQFDAKLPLGGKRSSGICNRMRFDLVVQLYAELLPLYERQVELLQLANFEKFRKNMSRLRVSPNLADDMKAVVQDSTRDFVRALPQLLPPKGKPTGWPSMSGSIGKARRELQEFASDRLLTARASGQYRPVPRKGIQIGLHWLLPKPFGSDFRQEPWDVHAKDNLIYVPKDKITDVSPKDVEGGGDWRKNVIPSPAGNEMMYLQ